jgi:hypothetical protein
MKFIPDFAQIVHPLRQLQKAKKWDWGIECQQAFVKLRNCLSEQTMLHHYVPGRETEVIVDASGTGLGAVLVQKPSKNQPFQVVSYRSRALKDVETRYSPTEREALAIRWAVKKLRNLLLGAPRFKVISDHKPLQYMFNKVSGDVPPRIERFIMDVQEFDYTVEYKPGKEMVADFLSRNHGNREGSSPAKRTEETVRRIIEAEVCHAINENAAVTMKDVQEAVSRCLLSQKVKTLIDEGGRTEDPDLEPYKRVVSQLSVSDGVICKGNKIVVPPELQRRVVRLCHKSHQGIAKTKSFARSFCWFPGIDAAIEKKVASCRQCQSVQDKDLSQPIKPHDLPQGPWQEVEMDFQGPYPAGEYIFVMIDRYTRWPEAEIMRRPPNGKTTTAAIKRIIQNKGTPILCQSDNGPPFQSAEMAAFARECGYEHKHVTPEWPRANGMVERFNRTMKEAVQAGHLEGKSIRESASEFLQMYRATPHSATNISPFEAMHGRRMRATLPMKPDEGDSIDKGKESRYKEKMRQSRKGTEHRLEVGDKVLMRQKKQNKLTPRFNTTEMTVTDVQGSSVEVSSGGSRVFRDASFFKRVESEEDDSDQPSGNEEPEAAADGAEETHEGSDEEADVEANDVETSASTSQPSVAAGRPRREARAPARFSDYVM